MGLILQDQFTRRIGPLGVELFQIMPFVSTHVHKEDFIVSSLCAFDEIILHGVNMLIHPAGSTLVVCGHEIVELRAELGILGIFAIEELEEMIFGVESQGEGTICALGGAAIVVLLQPCR